MNPLSLQTNLGIAKFQKEHTVHGDRQALADSASTEQALTDLIDKTLPAADNQPGDLAPQPGLLVSQRPGRRDTAVFQGNSQNGAMVQETVTPRGQGYRYTEFRPEAVETVQVFPGGAQLLHVDRKDPSQSFSETLKGEYQFIEGRPSAPPDKPDDVGQLTTTPSGLQYAVIHPGDGPVAEKGHPVLVDYSGWLTDGTRFDSSLGRSEPFGFNLGAGQVIKGWDEGVEGMKVGEKRRLTIPPELAYGNHAVGDIPPNSPLTFDVQLLATQ